MDALRDLAMENIDYLVDSGFTKPVTKIDLTHKEQIVKTVALHGVILVSIAGLSQFREGLYNVEK